MAYDYKHIEYILRVRSNLEDFSIKLTEDCSIQELEASVSDYDAAKGAFRLMSESYRTISWIRQYLRIRRLLLEAQLSDTGEKEEAFFEGLHKFLHKFNNLKRLKLITDGLYDTLKKGDKRNLVLEALKHLIDYMNCLPCSTFVIRFNYLNQFDYMTVALIIFNSFY
jgi:hypothetical protein